jgi:hypothetical protein
MAQRDPETGVRFSVSEIVGQVVFFTWRKTERLSIVLCAVFSSQAPRMTRSNCHRIDGSDRS